MNHKNGIPLSPSLEENFAQENINTTQPGISKRVLLLSIQAIINALIIGCIAKGLVMLIDLITNISFRGMFSFEHFSPANNTLGWIVMFIPVAGSVIIGIMTRFGSTAIRGHGIPEAIEKIIAGDSKIPVKITFLKPLSAAISIGTGGPFGAEGPIIATGGAFGSVSGQVMRISASERKIMLTAGACAGMSAIFGSPLAAILLAIELLLFEFSAKSIIPVALSCVAGAVMHIVFFGSEAVFSMPAIPVASGTALIIYIFLGVVIGVIAAFISKSLYLIEDYFEKLPVHWMWWPAIGAVAVGVIGYFAPITLGVGYENITGLLSGTLPVSILLVLSFLKYSSWVIALGSGTSGGTLAPLFTIGGAVGALLGTLVLQLFPSSEINIATAALIGMAAMFAGASRALLTSIVFLLETTSRFHGLLPLIGACTAAYFVSFFLMKGSIMTEKIQRRGIYTPETYKPDILASSLAGTIMHKTPLLIPAKNNTADIANIPVEKIINSETNLLVLVNERKQFAGYIEKENLTGTLLSTSPVNTHNPIAKQLPFAYQDQSLSSIAALMISNNMQSIAVVASLTNKQVKGVITAHDILKVYSKDLQKELSYTVAISLKRRTKKIMIKSRALMGIKPNKEKV